MVVKVGPKGLGSRSGACLLELAVLIPIILLLFFATADLGRQLAQMTWFSTVTYEAALRGAENTSRTGPSAMNETFSNMYDIHVRDHNNPMKTGSLVNATEYLSSGTNNPYDTTLRTVSADGNGSAKLLTGYLPLAFNFDVKYVAPMLTKETASTNFDTFGNDGFYYDCNGNRLGASPGSASACNYYIAPGDSPPPRGPGPCRDCELE